MKECLPFHTESQIQYNLSLISNLPFRSQFYRGKTTAESRLLALTAEEENLIYMAALENRGSVAC